MLRWEDCVKRVVREAEEGGKYVLMEKAVIREQYNMTTAKAVQQLVDLTPLNGSRRKNKRIFT